MSDLVPAQDIERIVGATRHPSLHIANAVSTEQRVYVLHPHDCLALHDDLRECPFSLALDVGINSYLWIEDHPCFVTIDAASGRLMQHIPVESEEDDK